MTAIGTNRDRAAARSSDTSFRTPRHPALSPWAIWPAITVGVPALTAYVLLRGAIRGHAALIGATARGPALLADYLLAVMIAGGFACVVWAAAIDPDAASARARAWLGWAVVTDVCAILFLCVGFDGGLGLFNGFKISLLAAGLFALFTTLATQLARRAGPGPAVVVPAALMFILFTLPAAAAPLLSIANRHDIGWLGRVLVNSSPTLWLLEIMHAAGGYGIVAWVHRRFLYGVTPLGQSMPVPRLLPWWAFVLITGILAALVSLPGANRQKNATPAD